ncbi:MAG: tRNA (guanine(46)-N(7))-methyltransferase TrmB [Alphaproteobacteria bacterium]
MDLDPRATRRHYGRRKGRKLRARQQLLMHELLPDLRLQLQLGANPRSYFPYPEQLKEFWLEIGFGAGEHLLWQAEHNPQAGIIGAESYISGIAKLLSKIAGEAGNGGLFNIRLYEGDARDVIAAVPDKSLSRVFLLFPDPWPKTRHHKRRFIQIEMLDELARVIREGGELRIATDDRGHLVWALERLMAHKAFRWAAAAPGDWSSRSRDWPETRYEAKAKKAGETCTYLRFLRLPALVSGP